MGAISAMYELAVTTSHVPAQSDMETREITIGALLREVAAARPEAEALVEVRQDGTEGRRWTYAELLKDAERLAMALSTRFAPGERVVIWSPNSPEWVLMEYACALSGLVLVTANPAFQARELAYVLEQSRAVALFLVEKFRGNPMGQIGLRSLTSIARSAKSRTWKASALYAEGLPPACFARSCPGRRRDDPIYVRHDRFSQGRGAQPSRVESTMRGSTRPVAAQLRRRPGSTSCQCFTPRAAGWSRLDAFRRGAAWCWSAFLTQMCLTSWKRPRGHHPWRADHGGGLARRAGLELRS